MLFKPPITNQTPTSRVADTSTDDSSTVPSITSTILTSTDVISTTERLKNIDDIKINVITDRKNETENNESTTVTQIKPITSKPTEIEPTLFESSTEFVTNNDFPTTKRNPTTNRPAIELYPKSATTENGFSYEVNEVPAEVNITYSNYPDLHQTMTKTDSSSSNSNVIIAVSVSVTCVILISLVIVFIYVMRKRQKQTSYGQRCRPVGLDAYSLDNVSVCHSMRRKGSSIVRQSKRIYGNAAFDDPSLKHNLLRAQDIVKFAEKRSSIYEEFRDVPQIIARSDEVPYGCEDRNR